MARVSSLTLAVAAAALVLTAAIVVAPFVDLAYQAGKLDAAVGTAAAFTAGLAAVVFAAFARRRVAGAVRETRAYDARLAEEAVLEERRRIARELHDGLAQELAFISSHGRRLARGFDPKVVGRMCLAADRALDESRGVISNLTTPGDEPFDSVIGQAAEEVARRYGVHVDLEVDPAVELRFDAREATRRIVKEAVGNAVRHGKAQTIKVEVTGDRGAHRIRVVDDGIGFDRGGSGGDEGGYGLVSMRERAAAVGGHLAVTSEPGDGTVVEMVVP